MHRFPHHLYIYYLPANTLFFKILPHKQKQSGQTPKIKKPPFIHINITYRASAFLSFCERNWQRVVYFMGKKKKTTWSLKKMMSKELWPWRFSWLFRRNPIDFQMFHFLVDNVFFKIVSVVEAIVLVSTLCFFLLCCGGHVWSFSFLFVWLSFSDNWVTENMIGSN